MGKRIITQRRGRGTSTYKSPSHRYKGQIKHRKYDDLEKTGVLFGKIVDLIHCPGHNAPLAAIEFENKEKILISAPEKVKVNDVVASGSAAPVQVGNTLPLKNIPEGTLVYNIENIPGDGGKLVRSSGSAARVLTKVGEKITIMLPSKKVKVLNSNCRATIGMVAGGGRKEKPFLKAGKKMHAMRARNKLYPRTSGVAMNAVDHPFGSGRGRHVGKPKTAPRWAPPGRNVGLLKAKKTGRGK
ncbi:50S ribosomal protein L2 [Candidatus Woesearchaeota archaeon]|nr:MAG: 50S ribosomal protein L2 [Candidatus Woesearchaeota archaeon]